MIFKNGIKLCGSLIVAAIISVFLCFSINVICSALFTAEIGYNAYVYKDKEAGLVVDYIGMAAELKNALSQYTKRDQDKVPDLAVAYAIAMGKR